MLDRVVVSQDRLSSSTGRCRRSTDSSFPCCRPRPSPARRSYCTSSAPIHVRRCRILGSIIHRRVSYRVEPRRLRLTGQSVGPSERASGSFWRWHWFFAVTALGRTPWSLLGRRCASIASVVRADGLFNTCRRCSSKRNTWFRFVVVVVCRTGDNTRQSMITSDRQSFSYSVATGTLHVAPLFVTQTIIFTIIVTLKWNSYILFSFRFTSYDTLV